MPSGPRGTKTPKSLAVTTVFRARCPVHVHGEEDGGSISGKVAFQKREGNRAKNESTGGSQALPPSRRDSLRWLAARSDAAGGFQ